MNGQMDSMIINGATGPASSGFGDSPSDLAGPFDIQPPTLPKGGGAIKGIDEKFQVNSINGTASFSIPVPVAPGRNGFSPSLSLSYNSGAGNSAFGLGWNISVPSITRKTDKGLPQYNDFEESDTFIIAGSEDLVPLLEKEGDQWNPVVTRRILDDQIYVVKHYRPRIEDGFNRIERWQNVTTGIIHWRTVTPSNITTLFGQSSDSRIADPNDPSRIFEWLAAFSYDDKGNCIQYEYIKEDLVGISAGNLHERNRLNGLGKVCNRYIKRVLYGNKAPYFPDQTTDPAYHFQTVFDYGVHSNGESPDKADSWDVRKDAFSHYRAGFEVRTWRRCERILLFHDFPELGNTPCLVQSLALSYTDNGNAGFSLLEHVTRAGYRRRADGSYTSKSLPPYGFEYQRHEWNNDIRTISPCDLKNTPGGVDQQRYRWVDLYGEGLPGVLSEQGGGLFYKSNQGNGHFSEARAVSPRPSLKGMAAGAMQIQDLEASGEKQLVSVSGATKGYFALDHEEAWKTFEPFKQYPNIDFSDPNLKILDLNGDGRPDLLISEERAFRWYPSQGKNGYGPASKADKPLDEEQGPAIVFSGSTQAIVLADMSGDGLQDIVRIRHSDIVYWPNLGYGKFGAKVSMSNAPMFDHPDSFNPTYLRLADLDGSGTTDIVYLGRKAFCFWLNLGGNGWSDVYQTINPFPEIDNFSRIVVMDLLGTGTSCIVWSSALPKHTNHPLQYIDLMASKKPHLMIAHRNNMGAEVKIHYKASTQFYLEDKKNGRPWVTVIHYNSSSEGEGQFLT
ncbi:MAG: VCBS repeat-containing protein [Desulfobacterales bacterium]|nr:VCBS repeat-containing protein [Desulfobacterales bacterium]